MEHDGWRVVRGTMTEFERGSHVTITSKGSSTRVEWRALECLSRPGWSASSGPGDPEAEAAKTRSAAVRFEPRDAETVLFARRWARSTSLLFERDTGNRVTGRYTLLECKAFAYEPLCVGPCETHLETGVAHRVHGHAMSGVALKFTLKPEPRDIVVKVDEGSPGWSRTGFVLMSAGTTSLVIAGIIGFMKLLSMAGSPPAAPNPALNVAALTALGVGGGLFAAGFPLVFIGVPSIDVKPRPDLRTTSAPRASMGPFGFVF